MEQELRVILGDVGGLTRPAETIGINDDLFAAGLTSFATVGVMLAIEDAFDIAIPDSLLIRATFRTLASLEAAICSLEPAARAA